jgi:uncharacterized protein (TIGR02145 family)
MIENLRLDDGAELSSTNTHNPSLPLNNSWYYRDQQVNLTISNYLSAPTDPYATAWCTSSSSACYNQSMLATNNTVLFTNNTSSSYSAKSNVYSYGNYYNWYSATAGNGKYGSDYGQGYESPGDICPIGWHLPTGGSASSDFGALDVAMGGTGEDPESTQTDTARSLQWRLYPNNFIFSGSISSTSSIGNRNNFGDYWSSSAWHSYYAYIMDFSASRIYPGSASAISTKSDGKNIRCIVSV